MLDTLMSLWKLQVSLTYKLAPRALWPLIDLMGGSVMKEEVGLAEGSGLEHYGLLAEFDSASRIYKACEQVRDAGFTKWDSYTPFPVHGLHRAMGVGESRIPWIALAGAMTGAAIAFGFQAWVHSFEYPLIISGKPYFAWPTYIPITFELGVLFAAFGCVFGMLGLNQLPRWYHSLFNSTRFERVTDDKFFIAIEAVDPRYDAEKTAEFLTQLGADHVELVKR